MPHAPNSSPIYFSLTTLISRMRLDGEIRFVCRDKTLLVFGFGDKTLLPREQAELKGANLGFANITPACALEGYAMPKTLKEEKGKREIR